VSVSAGATLTIEPGVVVKLNGATRSLTVNGAIDASGTAASPIVFTSYPDDSAGGDTNGDGTATTGAPGQWSHVQVQRGTGSRFRYVEVRFGSYGSVNYAAGALVAQGSGTAITVEQATISDNQRAGILALNGGATVSGSTLAR